MSTNLENRERKRERKIESRRQAREAQPEKERQRAGAGDKKTMNVMLTSKKTSVLDVNSQPLS